MAKLPRVRESHVRAALRELNSLRGLTYPQIGYLFFGDVKGDGAYKPTIWRICNEHGGVSYAPLGSKSLRNTLANIRLVIETEKKQREN